MTSCVCPPPLSPPHSLKARRLKFGRNNPHMYGSKYAKQNFDIFSKKLRYLSSKLCSELRGWLGGCGGMGGWLDP